MQTRSGQTVEEDCNVHLCLFYSDRTSLKGRNECWCSIWIFITDRSSVSAALLPEVFFLILNQKFDLKQKMYLKKYLQDTCDVTS